MKFSKLITLSTVTALLLAACAKPEAEPAQRVVPKVVSCSIEDGAAGLPVGTDKISLLYSTSIRIGNAAAVEFSGGKVECNSANKSLEIALPALEYSTGYTLTLREGAVVSSADGSTAGEWVLNFTTEKDPAPQPGEDPDQPGGDPEQPSGSPVCRNPHQKLTELYNYLLSIYGNKTLSGAMAKVDWNTVEADWVKKWTGRTPVIATMDYISLPWSPANWIDYSDIKFLKDWNASGGIVSACWHWNVPKYQNSPEYTFAAGETVFSVSRALQSGTWENKVLQDDLKKVASYLKLLQAEGIPVIWRPLHEAAGNTFTYQSGAWFWWGKEGGEAYRKLWKYMFDFFAEEGLNNLLWVWTSQTTGSSDSDISFYPGNNYVDIVGCDIYNETSAGKIASRFNAVSAIVPGKMLALSECGGVATIAEQWNEGAKWLFFMPWYDNDCDGTKTYKHQYADINWWSAAFKCDYVVSK